MIEEMKGLGKVPMTFIRAPYIESVQELSLIHIYTTEAMDPKGW